MPRRSAGLLPFLQVDGGLEVFCVHPGGPFFARKDAGVWSIAKGEYEPGEDPRAAALREFVEEVGRPVPEGELLDLGEFRQKNGKIVTVFAARSAERFQWVSSNTFEMVWPPRSGRVQSFVEVDRGEWFPMDEARVRLVPGQVPALDRLLEVLGLPGG